MISTVRTLPTPPPKSVPTTQEEMEQSFNGADANITYLRDQIQLGNPDIAQQASQLSHQVKTEFCDNMTGISQLPSLGSEAHKTALYAASAGLMAGALDGTLMMTTSSTTPPAPPPSAPAAHLPDKLKELLQQLEQKAKELAQKAKEMAPEALQKSSAAGKQASVALLDQSEKFATSKPIPVAVYQSYLTTMFAVGYSIGVNDAALIVVAKQPPGPWKS